MNKVVAGCQCTILFHVDDLKISHKNPDVVTNIINKLEKHYSGLMPFFKSRGKVHDYLGMTFEYSKYGKVKITMYQFINGLILKALECQGGMLH